MARRQEPTFDPYDLGARRSDPELAALEPIHPLFSDRWKPRNLLLVFAAGIALFAIARHGGSAGSPGPALTRSCTTPAFALSKTQVQPYGVIVWSATGPADAQLAFALDSTTLPTTRETGLLTTTPVLKGCTATGRFGLTAKEGTHLLTVFAIAADGPATTVGTKQLVITR